MLCVVSLLHPVAGAVRINEFMEDNPGRPNDADALLDMDGNSPGWIELYNDGAAAVNLTGWALSDDPANPGKWVFAGPVAPATVPTTIPANGYRMVFCGGLERNVANVEPHTSFRIDNSGVLLLSQPDGAGGWITVSRMGTPDRPYPAQRRGISYGYPANDAAKAPVFFPADTPGAANPAAGVSAFCADTKFSVDRGFHDTPFTLTISCATPGATIAYTLNGNVPSPTVGTQVAATDDQTPPSATFTISGTTIVRAVAWKAGLGSSTPDTHTYLFANDVLSQSGPLASMGLTAADTFPWGTSGGTIRTPAGPDWAVETGSNQYPNPANRFTAEDLRKLPVMSLVMPWRECFGPNTTAPDYAATPVARRGVYVGAEVGVPNERSPRAASLEFINPDGNATDPNARRGFQTNGRVHVFGGTSQQRWKSYKLSMNFKAEDDVAFPFYGDDAAPTHDRFILDARLNQAWVHSDATQRQRGDYVRDHVMADLQNAMGGHSFRTRPVHLFLNGLYWGLYLVHDQPDEKFMSDYRGGSKDDWDIFKHSAATGVDGNTVAGQVVASGLINPALALGSASDTAYFNCTTLRNYEEMLDLLGIGRVAPNPVPDLAGRAAYEAAAARIDIPSFIDYILLNCVAANGDWPHKNYYASIRRNDPGARWQWHSWDAEHVFRIESENTFTQGNWSGDGETSSRGPGAITRRLARNAEFRLQFADRAHRHLFNNGILSTAGLRAAFNRRFAEIEPWGVRGESARWGDNRSTAGQPHAYTTNGSFPTPVWTTEKNRILNTILPARGSLTATSNSALANLRSFNVSGTALPLYPAVAAPEFRSDASNAAQHGGPVPAGFSLRIHNPVATGTIYYTMDGSDPRTAWENTPSPGAQTYTIPIPLTASGTVRARILNGTAWSALADAYFSVATVPASATNLAVSELHYQPSPPSPQESAAGFSRRGDFEFIELLNISQLTVSLDGVRFGAGLDFTFDATSPIRELAPGARVLIVSNPAAFAMRYGANLPVAGTFQLGSGLSDSGETIELLAADSSTIRSFRYNDRNPWPEDADGRGPSLVLIRPEANPDHNLAQNWRPSATAHGSPGSHDLIRYSDWKTQHGISSDTADDDGDGFANASEFTLGTNPKAAANSPAITTTIQSFPVTTEPGLPESQADFLTVTFARDPRTDDLPTVPELSSDLASWSHAPTGLVRHTIVCNPDGSQTEVWRATSPTPAQSRLFLRLSTTLP